jgi:hypothetical protein
MNEAQWRTGADPQDMLVFLRGVGAVGNGARISNRKFRLFALACCHRIRRTIKADRFRQAIEVVERFADGRADAADLSRAAATVYAGDHSAVLAVVNDIAYQAAERTADAAAQWSGIVAEWNGESYPAGRTAEAVAQCALLRDICDNPFRPSSFDPAWIAWQDGQVRRLAQTIYEERAFERLPILGDALEDAGCSNPIILEHCRLPGEHVRGCWVADGILAFS